MASKDSYDPGWNDPPTFTYDKATEIQTAAANKKGNILNKRVAFPMSGKIDSQQGNSSTSDLEKPPMMQPPLMPPPKASSVTSQVADQVQKKSLEKKVEKDTIDEVLKNLEVYAISDDEILKRVRVMEKMWRDDKLDECVQLKILELSEALSKGDAETADHIQKSLMVDKISQCSSWMGGIRHLINQKRRVDS